MQSLVNNECGQSNPIVKFSTAIAHGISDKLITAEEPFGLLQLTRAEELAEEYLNNLTNTTAPPTTFDLNELKKQLAYIPDRPSVEPVEDVSKVWDDEFDAAMSSCISTEVDEQSIPSSTTKLASEWLNEFDNNISKVNMVSNLTSSRLGLNKF